MRIPILRWGQPYTSIETDAVAHFVTGEPVALLSRANAGLVERDARKAARARAALRAIPVDDLLNRVRRAGDLYMRADLPLGDDSQTPEQFARLQSATTGLPEHMCRANMLKNQFVLANMAEILTSLTRNLDLQVLTRGSRAR